MHEPMFVPIEFFIDVEARNAHLNIEDYVEMHGQPIRNPVSGEPVRAQICLPEGSFEYEVAEVGDGRSRSFAPIALEQANSYGQFANLHLDSHGVVRG